MPSRKSIRYKNFDYSNTGYYYITIKILSGKIGHINRNGSMQLNKYGQIVSDCWNKLFRYYRYIEQDEFIIMPDHIHGIIIINKNRLKTISQLVGIFKSVAAHKLHSSGLKTFKWQRSFYDRIIRTEYELINIRNYIRNNPIAAITRSDNPPRKD